jgi:site-specific recombinase XerD
MSTTLTISRLIKDFIADQDVSEASRALYNRVIRLYFRWLQANSIDYNAIRREHVISYKRNLQQTGKSQLTVDSYMTVVKLFYRWASGLGYYDNVAEGIKKSRKYRGFRKGILSNEQIGKLLEAPTLKTVKGKRDRAIIALLAKRGLRTIEVSRANVGDVTDTGMYVQRKGHTEKDEFVILTDETIETLQDYLVTRNNLRDNQPLFTSVSRFNTNDRLGQSSISKIVRQYLRQTGITDKHVSAHSLRHSIAVHLLQANVSAYDVQLFLGHSSIVTTQLYTRYAEEEMKHRNIAGHTIDELFKLSPNKDAGKKTIQDYAGKKPQQTAS